MGDFISAGSVPCSIRPKSIANNPDIREARSRDGIDAAIKRHADFELLYDKPYEDKRKVRVTGPFTVESLSPHRSLAFAGRATEKVEPDASLSDASFEQMSLDRLGKAGVQNGRRAGRLEFDSVEPHGGTYVQSIATRKDASSPAVVGSPSRSARRTARSARRSSSRRSRRRTASTVSNAPSARYACRSCG